MTSKIEYIGKQHEFIGYAKCLLDLESQLNAGIDIEEVINGLKYNAMRKSRKLEELKQEVPA